MFALAAAVLAALVPVLSIVVCAVVLAVIGGIGPLAAGGSADALSLVVKRVALHSAISLRAPPALPA